MQTVSGASSSKLMRAVLRAAALFLKAERKINAEAMSPPMVLEAVDGGSIGGHAHSISAGDSTDNCIGVVTLSSGDAPSVFAASAGDSSGVLTLSDVDANSVSAEDPSNASNPFVSICFLRDL
jgi:hypothetical protein